MYPVQNYFTSSFIFKDNPKNIINQKIGVGIFNNRIVIDINKWGFSLDNKIYPLSKFNMNKIIKLNNENIDHKDLNKLDIWLEIIDYTYLDIYNKSLLNFKNNNVDNILESLLRIGSISKVDFNLSIETYVIKNNCKATVLAILLALKKD